MKMNYISSLKNKLYNYIPFIKKQDTSRPRVPLTTRSTPTHRPPDSQKTLKNRHKRKVIPKTIRNQVWRRFCGDKLDAKCFCCDQNLSYECWEAGHVVAESNGGKTTIENLRPICLSCNRSMGKIHMFEFMKKHQLSGLKNI
jgi:hypothetical protein